MIGLVRAFLEDNLEQAKKFKRSEIYDTVIILIDSPGVLLVRQRETILCALEKYLKRNADFGGSFILAEGEKYNFQRLKTFDQVLFFKSSFISSS